MADTRRSVGRVPELARAWLEVAPDMREFLNSLQQIINDAQDEAGDVGSAIAFFMGSTFAGASGGWTGGAVGDGDKGDVTVSGGGSVYTIDADVVSNTKLANMAQSTIKGRAVGAGTGDPTDLTGTQATAILDNMVGDSGSGGTAGLVPAPGAGDAANSKFLKADGNWEQPSPGTVRSTTTLTNATPTPLFEMPVPTGAPSFGFSCGRVIVTVQIDDGTDFEAVTEIVDYAVVNKAGTITTNIASSTQASAFSTGAGMTVAYDTTTGTNLWRLRVAATTGLGLGVNFFCIWEVVDLTGNVATPQ